jgi:hypothetical protein
MMELNNQTHFSAGLFPSWSIDGKAQYTLVVKKVFDYDCNGQLVLSENTPELVMSDKYYDEPESSSVIYPSEIVPFKFGSEVIVTGKVFPPVTQPPVVMEATLGLRFPNGYHWSKSLLVIGERQWQSTLLGTVASDPAYLKPIDLIYEYAFGGRSNENPNLVCQTNPVGRGFGLSRRHSQGTLLPQIETPGELIKKPGKVVPVAGFGAIPPHWAPRIQRVPEIDELALVSGDYPYRSQQDPKSYNQAPEDQQFEDFDCHQIIVELKGLTENLDYRKTLQLNMPLEAPLVKLEGQGASLLALKCDTLIINTEQQSITQLWRTSIIKPISIQKLWVSILNSSNALKKASVAVI